MLGDSRPECHGVDSLSAPQLCYNRLCEDFLSESSSRTGAVSVEYRDRENG